MNIARGKDLTGRRAVVTGAASGMGAAAATRLMAEGVAVLGVDRVGEGIVGTHTLVADVGDADSIAAIAGAAECLLGGCDILINNAGVCPNGPFAEMTEEQWHSALGINVTAVMKLTRALMPLLGASGRGRVVNVGSIMSRFGDAGLVAYTTSKHAVLGLTRALAMELGPQGITVNCVQPGAIATGMTRSLFEDTPGAKDYFAGRSALGRVGQPEDVADVMVFLATDDARFITGQGIMVDGGVMVHS
ncbi:beta-ketoacyl-ACP reductase [Novosphingobium sediminis]|uniref:Beta-ketoacyl-ACP reductase n=1 Tax=Novosphingobium sediminis TaxID=707214 RepID=A0A512ANG4_9SPHN|nr:SDR family oxidoreductase [Novosphingobium sediminis]GEO01234.1 beta-ketoacyl-ACP reductase [Novosphingobium sediminis]